MEKDEIKQNAIKFARMRNAKSYLHESGMIDGFIAGYKSALAEKPTSEPDNKALDLVSTIPKFCFICGSNLEECGLGYYQCQSEKCREVFLPFIDEKQCLAHI